MKLDRVKGHLDLLLLAVVSESPGHGYAVITRLRDRSDGSLEFKEGTVYPALHRLEDRGLLASQWQPVDGRRRRIYRLTLAGERALDGQRSDWRALVSSVEAVVGRDHSVMGTA